MEEQTGNTFRILREKREVSAKAKDNLKQFIKVKKSILDCLKEKDMTVKEITQKTGLPEHEVVYYLMSLLKYGTVQTGEIDDMDEYFTYKLKK